MIAQLIACGNQLADKSNAIPKTSLSVARNLVLCERSSSAEQKKIFEEFYGLDDQINKLVLDYGAIYPDRFLSLNSSRDERLDLSPKHPLALSLKELKRQLKTIKFRFSQILTVESYLDLLDFSKRTFQYQFVSSVDQRTIENLIIDLRKQAVFAARFQNFQCKLNQLSMNADADVRTYLELKENSCGDYQRVGCLEHRLKYYNRQNQDQKEKIHSDFIKICKAVERKGACESYFFTFSKKNQLNKLYSTYLDIFKKKKYDVLFKIRSKHSTLSCREEDGVTIMTLPLGFNPKDRFRFLGGIKLTKQFVENMWSNKNFKLEIKEVPLDTKNTFRVIFKKGIISHVDVNKSKTISLNSKITKFTLSKTLAHEVGHVLGFNDCYIEYFYRDSDSIIYYELGREDSNLMCSINFGTKIPDSYFAELKKNVCQF